MSSPFVAEIRIFGFNFAPRGWAFCNGQLLPISQNTALFSLLGTYYGGDGKSTFGLPDLQGAAPMATDGSRGPGPGVSSHPYPGEVGGSQFVTLLQSEIPSHTHALNTTPVASLVAVPGPTVALGRSRGLNAYQSNTTANLAALSPNAIAPTGGDQPHNNLQPYLVLNFCIALQGVYPPRT
jgi:microcystin-dependent protein